MEYQFIAAIACSALACASGGAIARPAAPNPAMTQDGGVRHQPVARALEEGCIVLARFGIALCDEITPPPVCEESEELRMSLCSYIP